jgi:hypothetical protein
VTILFLLELSAYGLITFISVVNRDSYNLDETVYKLGSEEWVVNWRDFRIYNRTVPDCNKDCKPLVLTCISKPIEASAESVRFIPH